MNKVQNTHELTLNLNKLINLIVIGDSTNEMEAGQALSWQLDKCIFKSIKMTRNPSPQELIKQLQIINRKWEYIVNTFKNISVTLDKKLTPMDITLAAIRQCEIAAAEIQKHRDSYKAFQIMQAESETDISDTSIAIR